MSKFNLLSHWGLSTMVLLLVVSGTGLAYQCPSYKDVTLERDPQSNELIWQQEPVTSKKPETNHATIDPQGKKITCHYDDSPYTFSQSISKKASNTTIIPFTDFNSYNELQPKSCSWELTPKKKLKCTPEALNENSDECLCFWSRRVDLKDVNILDSDANDLPGTSVKKCLDDQNQVKTSITSQSYCRIAIKDIKAGQSQVGMYSVLSKIFQKDLYYISSKKLEKQLTTKTFPVVISPEKKLHLTDGHHRVSGFYLVTSQQQEVVVKILADYSNATKADFLDELIKNNYVYLDYMSTENPDKSKAVQEFAALPTNLMSLKEGTIRGIIGLWGNCNAENPEPVRPYFYQFKWGSCLQRNGLMNLSSSNVSIVNKNYRLIQETSTGCGFDSSTTNRELKFKLAKNPEDLISDSCFGAYYEVIKGLWPLINQSPYKQCGIDFTSECDLQEIPFFKSIRSLGKD